MYCVMKKVIFQWKLEIVIAKALNIYGLNILFHFIFIPIRILKIIRKLLIVYSLVYGLDFFSQKYTHR